MEFWLESSLWTGAFNSAAASSPTTANTAIYEVQAHMLTIARNTEVDAGQ
ncbi:hypothetical protein [Mycobacterium sp.]|jgi:hypothetical protein|nr:hypothetical protein [Mycobacterium sp.]